jgi:hypothetical protein
MSEHETPLVGLDELARMLETYEGPSGPRRRPARPVSSRRWTMAVAAGALTVGTAGGIAVASAVTPTADAGSETEGFGFLPARGWNVMQSGSLDRDGVARAIAANVPIDPRDGLAGEPSHTLGSLPVQGVLLSVTFSTRGDPAEDVFFPVRDEPLAMEQAEPMAGLSGARGYRLRAGIGGYNVDARTYLGSASVSGLAAAARQLERLVIASDQVTILARPPIVDGFPQLETMLYGTIASQRAGETVEIQAKDCGSRTFRSAAGTQTVNGGGWTMPYRPGVNTTLRAVWNEKASAQISVKQRARPYLVNRPRRNWFYVGVSGKRSFWHKHVVIQRFDTRSRRWIDVKKVLLTDNSAISTPVPEVSTSAEFRVSLPKGTLIRAVMPLSEAKPCYLGGVSPIPRRVGT